MAGKPLYKRILYKVSGEALMGDMEFGIDPVTVDKIASEIVEARALGVEIGVVIGGGNIFRGLSLAAKGADRVTGDHMGMMATVMNGLALRMAIEKLGVSATVLSGLEIPQVCDRYRQRSMLRYRDEGHVLIFVGGTGNPYFTTDTGAALRAAEFGAEAIFKGTQVDGIYSADPEKDKTATRYDTITFDEVLGKNLKVMDAAAVGIARDNDIPIVVFSIKQANSLKTTLLGESRATTVKS